MSRLRVGPRKLSKDRHQVSATGINWLSMDLSELMPLLKAWMHSRSIQRLGENFAIQEVGSWPPWIKFSALLAAFVLAFSVGVGVLGQGTRQELKAKDAEIEALRSQYTQLLIRSSTLHSYRQRVVMMDTQFSEMVDMIPSSLEMAQILDQVSAASQAGGIRILSFKPGTETRGDGFSVIPVEIRLSGEFHGIGRFLEAVSHMTHLLTVDLQIEPDPNAVNGQLILAARVQAYRGERAQAPVPAPVSLKVTAPLATDDR